MKTDIQPGQEGPPNQSGQSKRSLGVIASKLIRIAIPITILVIGGIGYALLSIEPEETKKEKGTRRPIKTQVVELKIHDYPTRIVTQGNIRPHNEVTLNSEVSGQIVRISPHFEDGAFFKKGEILIEIDASNYQAAVANAEAQLARTTATYALEKAEADQAKANWETLGSIGEPDDLVLRIPQLRQAFYGEQAQRVLQDVDDIRVMVRLPDDKRESLYTFERIKIRTPRGADIPLTTVANVEFTTAPTFVERNDRAEIIRIGAQQIDETVDIIGISKEITPQIQELCNEVEGISFQWMGYVAEAEESKRRTIIGSLALIFILYALLAIPFKSMVQPIFVLLALPFGVIGALLGHMIMGLTPSYLSIFGMLALAGVVVNDSLVMVDFINQRTREGMSLLDACLKAGGKRFRPIILTSVTTFVGLLPLMLETSLQAQFLIPMAVSLGFGVVFATIITLYLIPCSLLVSQDCGYVIDNLKDWYTKPFRNEPPETATVSQ